MPSAVALVLLLTTAAAPWPAGRLKPLEQVGAKDHVTFWNLSYSLDVEKVLKVHALTPEPSDEGLGQRHYAGSLTIGTGDPKQPWLFMVPAEQRVASAWAEGPFAAKIDLAGLGDNWTATQQAGVAVGYPAVWSSFSASGHALPLKAALLGWGWTDAIAPTHWLVGGKEHEREPGKGIKLQDTSLLAWTDDEHEFSVVLKFDPQPAWIVINDDGLQWEYEAGVGRGALAQIVVDQVVDDHDLRVLAKLLGSPPVGPTQTFGHKPDKDGQDRPWVKFSQRSPDAFTAICPSLSQVRSERLAGSLIGPIILHDPHPLTVLMFDPPGFDQLVPPLVPLPAPAAARLAKRVRELLGHQQDNGSFDFSQTRSFFDGSTATILAQVLPLLPDDLRAQTQAAVKRCLDHLWDDQVDCPALPDFKFPPEQEGYWRGGIDYAEIMGCVLEATATYAAVDPDYAKQRWEQIQQHFLQLRTYQDWTGVMLAAPGPDPVHAIAESGIGGCHAWWALYHLSVLTDQTALADEARGRCGYAWFGLALTCSRRSADQVGVVNGLRNGTFELSQQPAWCFVQYNWFSYLPMFLVGEYDFGLPEMLSRQPWWEWTGQLGSTQRAYDFANALTLWRLGQQETVKQHWAEILDRPYTWQWFDAAPVMEVAALAWLGRDLPVP